MNHRGAWSRVVFAVVAAGVLCAVLASPGVALANMGVARWDRTSAVGAGNSLPTEVEVEKEKLVFRCDTRGSEVVCEFSATYFLVNPGDEAESVVGAFFSEGCEEVDIELDGEAATRRLSAEEFAAVEERIFTTVARDIPGAEVGVGDGGLMTLERARLVEYGYPDWILEMRDLRLRGKGDEARVLRDENLKKLPGYAFDIGAKERRILVAQGRMRPGVIESYYGVHHAVEARHMALGGVPQEREFAFRYLLSPLRTWAAAREVEISFEYPDHMRMRWGSTTREDVFWRPRNLGRDLFEQGEASEADRSTASDDGVVTQTWSCAGEACDEEALDSLYFAFFVEEPLVVNGGFSFRLGGRFGTGDSRFVGGLGYELCIARWFLLGINAETDFTRDATVVPTLSLATPWIWVIIPSLSAGIGAPIQIDFDGRVDVGVRVQLDMMFGPIGIALPFDLYPGRFPDHPGRFQVGVMMQVGL